MNLEKKFINIEISCPIEFQETAIALSSNFDFEGIVENNSSLEYSFLTEYFDENIENEFINSISILSPEIKIINKIFINEKNWNEEWEQNVPAIHVNDKIGIAPTWKFDELTEDIKIKINPKMSFGSGNHATTRLVCKLMDGLVKPNSHWIDAGTGTGVLAILAIKLGAASVYAFDNNEWSINNTIDNLKLNNCLNQIKVQQQDIDEFQIPKCDNISANLITNVILRSMNKFKQALNNSKGHLLASGILIEHRDEVLKSATDNGFELIKELTEDEWIAFDFKSI